MIIMDILLDILAVVLGLLGIIGCVLPIIPGPPISYAGVLILYFWGSSSEPEISTQFAVIWLIITIAVTVLDFLIPAYLTRMTGGSKSTARASMLGMLLGIIFFPPIGMIIGAFAGALISEMIIEGKELKHSLKPALGSFLGFLVGTGFKLIASSIMLYYIIIEII